MHKICASRLEGLSKWLILILFNDVYTAARFDVVLNGETTEHYSTFGIHRLLI
jgi:hypothetical protein